MNKLSNGEPTTTTTNNKKFWSLICNNNKNNNIRSVWRATSTTTRTTRRTQQQQRSGLRFRLSDLFRKLCHFIRKKNRPRQSRDGLELLQRIRTSPGIAELRVMVLSAANDKDLFRRAQELGVFAWLVKPANPEAIVLAIEKTLETDWGAQLRALSQPQWAQSATQNCP